MGWLGLGTGAVTGVDGDDVDDGGRGRRRGTEGESVGGADLEDVEEGKVEIGKLEGEEFGGEWRAEERAVRPCRREAFGVVGVKVGQEVSLASLRPTVHRYQPVFHCCCC